MESTKIYEKIEKIYQSEKGKKFIIHLIRSFFPLSKSYFMWDPIENAKCCITGISLLSKEEVFKSFMEVGSDQFQYTIKKALGEITEEEKSPLQKALNGKILGIKTEQSDKLLCQNALDQLFNFYSTQLLKGDKHIKWVGKDMMRRDFVKNNDVTKEENKSLKKVVSKPATTKLEDFDVLKKLKDKLIKEESNNLNKS